jgi:hypothetical protein
MKNKIFYKLKNQCESKYVGSFPQIQRYKKGYITERRNSMTKTARYFFSQNPGPELDVDGLVLAPKAKLTDFLTSTAFSDYVGLLISERLLKIIQSVTTVNYEIYPAPIYNKDEEVIANYFYIHYTQELPELIDFKEFKIIIDNAEKPYEILLKNETEYKLFIQKNPHANLIYKDKIIYKNKVDNFDIFRDGIFFCETIISEKAMQLFVDNKITGLEFIKITNIFINED